MVLFGLLICTADAVLSPSHLWHTNSVDGIWQEAVLGTRERGGSSLVRVTSCTCQNQAASKSSYTWTSSHGTLEGLDPQDMWCPMADLRFAMCARTAEQTADSQPESQYADPPPNDEAGLYSISKTRQTSLLLTVARAPPHLAVTIASLARAAGR